MKVYRYCLTVIFTMLLFACDKETEGLSKITVPYDITLEGGETVLVELGSPYEEPGYAASGENETDVTNTVVVSGTLNTGTIGRYTLRYTVNNPEGAITVAKRTVIVFDPATPTGFYKVSADSYRTSPPSSEYASEPRLLVYQEESGAYFISDFFGGYYSVGRGYGAAYETGGSVKINKAGEVSLSRSSLTPWGDQFSSVTGTYNADTQVFEIDLVWESGYTFHLILIKE
ncbi:MAG: DUF5012 domain-containing protein [Tannerella sp.]|jgi:hypothetical protein|nr:DUF5012 domain-containing protein [Tannerella sp.]